MPRQVLHANNLYHFKIATGHEYLIRVIGFEWNQDDHGLSSVSFITLAGFHKLFVGMPWKKVDPMDGTPEHCYWKDFDRAVDFREVPITDLPLYINWPFTYKKGLTELLKGVEHDNSNP